MKAYIGFDRHVGPEEGAVLIFANTAREAKKISFGSIVWGSDEWTDYAVRWLKNDPDVFLLGDQEKLAINQPHVIDDPLGCNHCGFWNAGITEDDLCCNCMAYPGDELIELLKSKEH